jgi:hypothetical protein
MKRALFTVAVMTVGAAGLSACGGGGKGDGGVTTPTPTPPAAFSAQFGTNFSTAYQAGANGEPRDVVAGDVIAVNPTAEPVALPAT